MWEILTIEQFNNATMKYIIQGGNPLKGEITVSGAKNVALPAIVASLLTDEKVEIVNEPKINDVKNMHEIVKTLDNNRKISLETGAKLRTSSMVIGPLLSRKGECIIPNPGGCRIGARPIDRHIEGLQKMGAKIDYNEDDGYFYCSAKKLKGIDYKFKKNTHTGTEAMILAAVLADGHTILENAAAEPEVDDLIRMLNLMGAKIKRVKPRMIVIDGVKKLFGIKYEIIFDRNEAVTFAISAIASRGNVIIHGTQREYLSYFLAKLDEAEADWEPIDNKSTRFYWNGKLKAVDVQTNYYPGFMTDWQGPWCLLMTQALGDSIIHEIIYENRFGYVQELLKMGAKITMFNPDVKNAEKVYNFNLEDDRPEYYHAIRISGPMKIHNAVVNVADLRAGATLVLAALIASGESILYGIEHLDRGYENLEKRLQNLGAKIKRKA